MDRIPIEKIGRDVAALTGRLRALTASPDIDSSLHHLNATLTQADRITAEVEPQVGPLTAKLRQAADQNYHPAFVTTSGFSAPEFASIAGATADGTVFPFPPDFSQRPSAAGALDAFKADGVPADGFTLFSYATIQALAEGVRRANSTDGAKVTAALRQGPPISTAIGPLRFDAKGDAEGITYQIDVWNGGKYAPMD